MSGRHQQLFQAYNHNRELGISSHQNLQSLIWSQKNDTVDKYFSNYIKNTNLETPSCNETIVLVLKIFLHHKTGTLTITTTDNSGDFDPPELGLGFIAEVSVAGNPRSKQ
jgi:hypothetical protein